MTIISPFNHLELVLLCLFFLTWFQYASLLLSIFVSQILVICIFTLAASSSAKDD